MLTRFLCSAFGAALILSASPACAQSADLGAAIWYDSNLGPTLSLNLDQPAAFGPNADLRFAVDGNENQLGLKANVTVQNAFGTDLTQGVLLNGFRYRGRADLGQDLAYSGGELSTRIGKVLADGLSWNASFGARQLAIDRDSNLPDAIADYIAVNGATVRGGFAQFGVALDRHPNAQPGYRLGAVLELGRMGQADYGKLSLSGDMFHRLGDKTTLHSRARLGRGFGLHGDDFPLFQNFTAGGAGDLRGYGLGGIGPVSGFASGDDLAHIGGDTAFSAGVEVARALTDELSLISFADTAAINDGGDLFADLRSSVGLGLRWSSPIGPLDVSFAHAINPKTTDVIAPVQVTFGVKF